MTQNTAFPPGRWDDLGRRARAAASYSSFACHGKAQGAECGC